MPSSTWEVHWDGPASGRTNMAKDALLLRRAAERGTAALRLYSWDRPTLSVGQAQKAEREVDLAACAARGIPLVRRPTGGRAVLHGTDLTYAVAAPLGGAHFGGGIPGIYRELSAVFLRFFADLGLGPNATAHTGRERAQSASPVCFVTPSAFEILLRGRKIVGSAQRQTQRAFLQHGSIPLEPQHETLGAIFLGADSGSIAVRMSDLRTEGCYPQHSLDSLRQGLAIAFSAVLNIELVPAEWTAADAAAVAQGEADYPWLTHEATASAMTARR